MGGIDIFGRLDFVWSMQPDRDRLRISALLGFLAIALGSMGAHGAVHDQMLAAGELDHWRTAWSYHMPHALVLAGLAFLGNSGGKWLAWSWRCFFAGVLLFSGSLYLLAYTQKAWLAHVTPFGGLSLMAGWLFLAMARWPRT
jgi:uncharacterized membrane protein YgdD (TMEM256/DUF423 family)